MSVVLEAQEYIKNGNEDIATVLLNNTFTFDRDQNVLVYKKVANKIKPVSTTTPNKFKIHRHRPAVDPLTTVPPLPTHAPEFEPGERLTRERLDDLGVLENEFLTKEERKLVAHVLKTHEQVLAFDESHKGRFKMVIFPSVVMPVTEHVPWAVPSLKIAPSMQEDVVRLIKAKVSSGTYEPSTSSYRHQWFCVAKKDGGVRIVHNLGPLNQVTIR
ncbi:hypothetical protein FA13DRAFT_1644310, partial [Coprinellus micaceus]